MPGACSELQIQTVWHSSSLYIDEHHKDNLPILPPVLGPTVLDKPVVLPRDLVSAISHQQHSMIKLVLHKHNRVVQCCFDCSLQDLKPAQY